MAASTPYVVHPAAFTFKLPDNVSFAEAAMVEPFAVGVQAAVKAEIKPGDIGVVTGAGPIGIMVALAALLAGCSRVFISDLVAEKLAIAGALSRHHPGECAGEVAPRGRARRDRRLGRGRRVRGERVAQGL